MPPLPLTQGARDTDKHILTLTRDQGDRNGITVFHLPWALPKDTGGFSVEEEETALARDPGSRCNQKGRTGQALTLRKCCNLHGQPCFLSRSLAISCICKHVPTISTFDS